MAKIQKERKKEKAKSKVVSPEQRTANYLRVKGIFNLCGPLDPWRKGPWKIGVAHFHCLLFT